MNRLACVMCGSTSADRDGLRQCVTLYTMYVCFVRAVCTCFTFARARLFCLDLSEPNGSGTELSRSERPHVPVSGECAERPHTGRRGHEEAVVARARRWRNACAIVVVIRSVTLPAAWSA